MWVAGIVLYYCSLWHILVLVGPSLTILSIDLGTRHQIDSCGALVSCMGCTY